ncbi:MAG: Fic family protein [Armatimonadetes bacterium]|nr:Fic family protein [Armatimonadota bacterium]
MPRNRENYLPEVFLSGIQDKGLGARAARAGKIRTLRRGLYTTNMVDSPEIIVKKNLWRIVSLLCPGGVVSHRTAFDAVPSPNGQVFVTTSSNHTIELPGFQIRQIKGHGPLDTDRPFLGDLRISSQPRFLLECLSGNAYADKSPYLPQVVIEKYLDNQLNRGEDVLNQIRDLAKPISQELNLEKAYQRLDAIIGALLGTRRTRLRSDMGWARSKGQPFDSDRMDQFQTLFQYLNDWPVKPRPDTQLSGIPFQNIAFFDAYFSNYIEGTEFEVNEAKEIALGAKIPTQRPADGHDILGTFQVASDPTRMATKISELSTDAFIDALKNWHAVIMSGRPEKRPGRFKEESNRAGTTVFVSPGRTEGTLRLGFEMGRAIASPFGRAVYLMYLLSEVHPFDDGNGRVTRAIVNAELVSRGEQRIIIATAYRTEYIDALKRMSQQNDPKLLPRMMDFAQDFVASIDFTEIVEAESQLKAWGAFDEGPSAFLRRPM